MTKLRLDQLRDSMNQCSTQIKTKIAEEKAVIVSIKNITSSYDKLTSEIAKEKNNTKSKEHELQTISKNILDTKQEVDKEISLIETLNKYLGEYNESQQIIPDINLVSIEGAAELNQMIGEVNQEL